jgi:hypothetical protein
VTSSSRSRSDGPADAADASPDDADPCFPFLDAAPVLVAGPDDWTAAVADDLAGAHGFAVERSPDATAATVDAVDPDCVVLRDPERLRLARSVPVVLTADLDDDAVARVLEHADYVPAGADTPDRDLLAARVASVLDRRQRDTERSRRAAAMAQAGVGITIAGMRRPDEPLVYANESFVDVTGYPSRRSSAATAGSCRVRSPTRTRSPRWQRPSTKTGQSLSRSKTTARTAPNSGTRSRSPPSVTKTAV